MILLKYINCFRVSLYTLMKHGLQMLFLLLTLCGNPSFFVFTISIVFGKINFGLKFFKDNLDVLLGLASLFLYTNHFFYSLQCDKLALFLRCQILISFEYIDFDGVDETLSRFLFGEKFLGVLNDDCSTSTKRSSKSLNSFSLALFTLSLFNFQFFFPFLNSRKNIQLM